MMTNTVEQAATNRLGPVVITGASTGIGAACAQRLAQAGFQVFAGVRKPADGVALQASHPTGITPLLLDVTDAAQRNAAYAQVAAAVGEQGLVGLVNNAGIALGGPLEFLPLADLHRQMEVNVYGALGMIQSFLPLLRQARGRIINMSSISGLVANPFIGPYAASKYALEALSDALRLEVRPWGIAVVLIEPGSIETPIWQKGLDFADQLESGLPAQAHEHYGPIFPFLRQLLARSKGTPVEAVAQAVEQALTAKQPKARYLVGKDAHWRLWIERLPTRWRDRVIEKRLPAYGKGETAT
ncbi:MAG: SDR family oxidoreductase [Caldilineaceae bacterium]|nr:SDR family oxidoreductase [Caldilineaceae bacterium]